MDFIGILEHSEELFGYRQSKICQKTLLLTISSLEKGPDVPRSKPLLAAGAGLRIIHVAQRGRKGRHFLV